METRENPEIKKLVEEIIPILLKLAAEKKLPAQKQPVEAAALNIINMNETGAINALNFIQSELNNVRMNKTSNISSTTGKAIGKIENLINKSNLYQGLTKTDKEKIKNAQTNDLNEKVKKGNHEIMPMDNLLKVYQTPEKWLLLEEITKSKSISEYTDFYKAYVKCAIDPTAKKLLDLNKTFISDASKTQINFEDDKNGIILKNSFSEMILKVGKDDKVTPDMLKLLNDVANFAAKTLNRDIKNDFQLAQQKPEKSSESTSTMRLK